jgi:triosephosphate isomerase
MEGTEIKIMKHIYLNLKRFDVPVKYGGVNRIASVEQWGAYVVKSTQDSLMRYSAHDAEFVQFFPEAHILSAVGALCEKSPLKIGSQGIYRMNTSIGGNFGAFTTNRPASIVKAMGCAAVIIGHCEERNDKSGILEEAGITDDKAVNRILNKEIKAALAEDIDVLYCVGETSEELYRWRDVLISQLELGLEGADRGKVVIAYEPVWSIGPGKKPADQAYVTRAARFIKEFTGGMDVVYGGGLKTENAKMLSAIDEIDGGLIALTRFDGEIGFYPDEYLEIIKTYFSR